MDDLDHKIVQLLSENARMPVKDIAQKVSLTSPAVSSRIHRLEQEGIIAVFRCCVPPAPPPVWRRSSLFWWMPPPAPASWR